MIDATMSEEERREADGLAAAFVDLTGQKMFLHKSQWDACCRAGLDMTRFELAEQIPLVAVESNERGQP